MLEVALKDVLHLLEIYDLDLVYEVVDESPEEDIGIVLTDAPK